MDDDTINLDTSTAGDDAGSDGGNGDGNGVDSGIIAGVENAANEVETQTSEAVVPDAGGESNLADDNDDNVVTGVDLSATGTPATPTDVADDTDNAESGVSSEKNVV